MFDDTYKTLKTTSKGLYTEKGSKFIAFAFPVCNEEEVKSHIATIKKNYYDASHHCYAYILGADKSSYRLNDDGEPSGTAGRPIYGQLLSFDITHVLLIVVRYFGGIKLGVSGLIHAYRSAAKDAILNNEIIEKTIDETYKVYFDYQKMNEVMQILKQNEIKINNQEFENQYIITFTIRRSLAGRIIEALQKLEGVKTYYPLLYHS